MACHERALALKPDCPEAHYNLGCALLALGDLDGAIARYRKALAIKPEYAQARFSESVVLLHKEEFASGWPQYASRWQTKEHQTRMRNYPQPVWTGAKLTPVRVLIWPEQGVGE